MGAWSPHLDGDQEPATGVELVLFVPRIQMGRVFRGTQLGYIGSRIVVSVRRYDLAMV